MAIHLGHRFPGGSSGAPGPSAGRVIGTCFALHRTGFGEPPCHHGSLVGSYPTVSPLPAPEAGGLLSVPLSVGFRRLGFPQRPALWCPDFPRTPEAPAAIRPARRLYSAEDAASARGSTTSGTSRPSASSERHSGQARTPRSRITNSPHVEALEAGAAREREQLLVERPREGCDVGAHRRLRNTPTTLPRILTWSA